MKLKEKIVGSIGILVLSLVFLISGHLISKREAEVKNQIFTENEKESIFVDSNNTDKVSIDYKANKTDKVSQRDIGEKKDIIVDIKGAIANPKEYKLAEGARVRDLIQAAGGITEEADENTIYFSKVLRDEECIIIYKKGEAVNNDFDLNKSIGFPNSDKEEKININKATQEQLSTLYGIGEVKAKAIIEYREKNGGFKSIDDLGNVDGIGSKTVDKLRDKVDIKWVLV